MNVCTTACHNILMRPTLSINNTQKHFPTIKIYRLIGNPRVHGTNVWGTFSLLKTSNFRMITWQAQKGTFCKMRKATTRQIAWPWKLAACRRWNRCKSGFLLTVRYMTARVESMVRMKPAQETLHPFNSSRLEGKGNDELYKFSPKDGVRSRSSLEYTKYLDCVYASTRKLRPQVAISRAPRWCDANRL